MRVQKIIQLIADSPLLFPISQDGEKCRCMSSIMLSVSRFLFLLYHFQES